MWTETAAFARSFHPFTTSPNTPYNHAPAAGCPEPTSEKIKEFTDALTLFEYPFRRFSPYEPPYSAARWRGNPHGWLRLRHSPVERRSKS